jgi:hypothetical protein
LLTGNQKKKKNKKKKKKNKKKKKKKIAIIFKINWPNPNGLENNPFINTVRNFFLLKSV